MVKNTSTRARIITHYAIVVIDFDNQIKQADQVSRSEFEIKRLTTSCLFPHEEDYCCLRDHNCCSQRWDLALQVLAKERWRENLQP